MLDESFKRVLLLKVFLNKKNDLLFKVSFFVALNWTTHGLSNTSSNLTLQNGAMKKPFYEDNPKYIDRSYNQNDWRHAKPAKTGINPDWLFKAEQELEKSPSILSFIVIKNGAIICEKYFNGSKPNYSYNIHSASKGIISALIGIAIDKGFIKSLDEKIYKILPEYMFDKKVKKSITLHHLLSMTAGFQWEEDKTEYDLEKKKNWIQAIINQPMSNYPGKVFKYSTGQSHLLSAVLTKKTGMSTFSFAKRFLLDPLNITVEHWGSDPQGYFSGGYNVYMTAREFATFAKLYLDKGQKNGKRIISERWIQRSLSKHSWVDQTYWYGYQWWIRNFGDEKVYKLWGYGGQLGYLFPKHDVIVILTNDTSRDYEEMDGDLFISRYIIPSFMN